MDTPRLLKDRYRLGTVIGRGGMGVVWLATDEVLDRSVAVKEVSFPPGLPHEEQEKLRRRTLREARTTARLNHPNVVGVYDIVEDEDRPWIVMEFVPSQSLAEVLRADGPLTPQRTAEIGTQLLRGLRAAHLAGVLHRDVKPSNVLLAEDGRVVLGDFGIATAKGGSTVTSSGVLIGSPSYMAPERARGSDVGPESDLWSLGATLYTAVEGRPPFGRDSAVATLAALVMDDPDAPERAGPLWPLIRGLLERDPARRPQVEAVASILDAIAAGDEPPAVEPAHEPAAEPVAYEPDVGLAEPAPPSVPRPRAPLDDAPPEPAPAGPETGAVEEMTTASPSYGEATGTVSTTRTDPRRVMVAVLAVVGVLAVVLLGWAATTLVGDDDHDKRSAEHPGTTPSASHASTTPSVSQTPSSPPASPPASPTKPVLPSGYHWHHDSTHFSIAVPDGWSASHHGHYLYVEDPKSSRLLIVDQSDTPKSDPLADWKEQESARKGGFSGYHKVRLESVDYPQAKKAADWEFTYNGSHGRTHVLNRNILANKKHAYALYWEVPDSRWKSSKTIFDNFAKTFQPAKA
ncbi:serine/threonine-protein kinase [Actinomadura sp. DC4]|uniref:serine/threonine-protein kinase n=1 Tax=Actinomadura sp. DC4 TaxID=3055069 RepID=UPI0025B24E44|nr:serine/threonine-protein kinase [Actinomadura sp. DC4]MDN3355069.1 serine/threonine-protein kinase [Actinomadura sp. DC4]